MYHLNTSHAGSHKITVLKSYSYKKALTVVTLALAGGLCVATFLTTNHHQVIKAEIIKVN